MNDRPLSDQITRGYEEHVCDELPVGDWASDALYLENEVSMLRVALADAIRRPLGIIPDSADLLMRHVDLEAAEKRRTQ